MKVVILAGGLGTRLGNETNLKPKPMVEISSNSEGDYPILWHIMKIYAHYGHTDFIILGGYKQEVIKDYFLNFHAHHSTLTIDLENNSVEVHRTATEPWKVTIIDTGRDSLTGARVRKARPFIGNETFMLTYGDGVSDVDLNALLEFHRRSGKLCTLTSVQPSGRFGAIEMNEDGQVNSFEEKPKGDGSWINGGFMVCEPGMLDYIPEGEGVILEQEPLRNLVRDGQLAAFCHHGFWKACDTPKDKADLCELWNSGHAPWKVWNK